MRSTIRGLALVASQTTILICGACESTGPQIGDLELSVASAGVDIDLDGYSIAIDGEPRGTVSANGTLAISNLAAGFHTIAVSGVAENCSPASSNAAQALVHGGQTTRITLIFRCVVSGVFITVVTTGPDPDADGYTITLDGKDAGPVPSMGTLQFTRLTSGNHTLAVSGIASNCSLTDDTPQNFSVVIGALTPVTVHVACLAASGVVEIRATTSGVELDPNGYNVRLDATSLQPLDVNGVTRFTGVPGGSHAVALEGVADNCIVAGENPRTLSVSIGGITRDTARSAFAVTCASMAGAIHVTTTTSGGELDPDGYELLIDETCDYYYGCTYNSYGPMGLNDSKTVPSDQGSHVVVLNGVARNCTVAGGNSQTVTVTTGLTTEVPFAITCVQTGSVDVTTTTTGSDLDADGYVISFYGPIDTSTTVANNITKTIAELLPGNYTVTLSGLAINCTVNGSNPQTITVTSGASTPAAFDVTCAVARQLAFVAPASGDEIYRVKENGTDLKRLTNNLVADEDPAWSPDGLKIAFRSDQQGNGDIYTMNADGSNVTPLTTAAAPDYEPSWSPDGTKIAFTSERDGHAEIYVMNADGSNQTRLTVGSSASREPAWSPDGTQIAFANWQTGSAEIYVMQSDGTNPQRLTTSSNNELPSWSPDGSKIAFQHLVDCYYGCSYELYTMNPNGSGATPIGLGTDPDWSHDGKWIAFVYITCDYYYNCYNNGIYAMHPDGGQLTPIQGGPAWSPAWRP